MQSKERLHGNGGRSCKFLILEEIAARLLWWAVISCSF